MRTVSSVSEVDNLEEMFGEDLPPSKNRRSVAKVVTGVLSAAAAIFVFTSAWGFIQSLMPADYDQVSSSEAVKFAVQPGSGVISIAGQLEEEGVVASSRAFLVAAREAGYEPVSGLYRIPARASAEEIVASLSDESNREVVTVVIPEGTRASGVTERLVTSFGFEEGEVDDALSNAALPEWEGVTTEGLLFPATYEFTGLEDPQTVVNTFVRRAISEARELKVGENSKNVDLTPYEVYIVASLLQAEVLPRDYEDAAAVIYNRLEQGMPLQLDSTVNYAQGTSEIQLSAEELQSESAYNTYKVKGLPPTAIGNPGTQALLAALSPSDEEYLYFVTVNPETGKTKFSTSYEKFLKHKDQLRKNLQ